MKEFSRIAFAMDKSNFCLRMAEQDPDQFPTRITGTADDTGPYRLSPGFLRNSGGQGR
jgi:hypothetical protein